MPDYARHLANVGVGRDVLPYTEAELARLRRDGSAFLETVYKTSVVLAARHRS